MKVARRKLLNKFDNANFLNVCDAVFVPARDAWWILRKDMLAKDAILPHVRQLTISNYLQYLKIQFNMHNKSQITAINEYLTGLDSCMLGVSINTGQLYSHNFSRLLLPLISVTSLEKRISVVNGILILNISLLGATFRTKSI